MSWYHTDWSWTQTLTTAAEIVVLCGIVLWAIAEWARTFRHPHGHEAVVKKDFARAPRSNANASPHHPNQKGTRAA